MACADVCADVRHAATQCFDAGQSQHADLREDTAGAAAHIATAGEQIFVKTPCVASRLLGHFTRLQKEEILQYRVHEQWLQEHP